jgi:hypothetical protein
MGEIKAPTISGFLKSSFNCKVILFEYYVQNRQYLAPFFCSLRDTPETVLLELVVLLALSVVSCYKSITF